MAKKIVIGVVIVALMGIMIFLNIGKNSDGDQEKTFNGKSVSVEVEQIGTGDIASSIVVSGTVSEINKKNIVSDMPLSVSKVLVEEGEMVKKGDKLFELDLSDEALELEKAKINYDIQTLQLKKLQASSSGNGSTAIGVEIAQLNLDSAQRNYDKKAEELEKKKTLLEEGIISQSDYDLLESALEEAASALDSSELTLKQNRANLSSGNTTTDFDIQVQVKNLENLNLTIADIEDKIQAFEALTLAPMTGVITELNLDEGDKIQAMSQLMTITDMTELEIGANVREYDIKEIKLGDEVLVTGDAISKESIVKGKVSYVSPVAEDSMVNGRETTAVAIDILVTQGIEYLKPGYKTDCEVMTEVKKDVVIADYNMFKDDKDGNTTVFVIHEDGRIEQRTIELGITADFDAEVVEGLEAGDLVVLSPSLVVKDGMKAKITNEASINTTGE